MEYIPLEITIISAKGLKDVGHFSKMDVYVAVTISGDHRTEQKTPVDKDGGSSPSWNHTMKFIIDKSAAQMNRVDLIFQLRHERTLLGNKDVGEVHVPVKELLGNAGDGKSVALAEYPVRNPSGKAKGTLKFSYKFGADNRTAGSNSMYPPVPVRADPYPQQVAVPYAPPAQPPPAGYPPAQQFLPQPPAGYHAPAPYTHPAYGGYAPPPAAAGYGYPPVQQAQQRPQKNKFGTGLGVGLAGGLIGGMLIGDMVSDSSDAAYDSGYDAGFDDGGGGDFDF